MFRTSVDQNWLSVDVNFLPQVKKNLRQSKNVIHTSWLRLDEQVEAFHVGAIN